MTCRPECKNKYTHLQYWSSLDLYKRPHPVSLTGIIVSLGKIFQNMHFSIICTLYFNIFAAYLNHVRVI